MKHYFIEYIAKNNILIQNFLTPKKKNAPKNTGGNKISFVLKLNSWRSDVLFVLFIIAPAK